MKDKLSKTEILKRIESRQLSSEEGLRLLKELSNDTVYFTAEWKTSVAEEASALSLDSSLVLFDRDDTLYQSWRARGSVILVTPGATYADLGDGRLTINPGDATDYGRLVQRLQELGAEQRLWVYRGLQQASDYEVEEIVEGGIIPLFLLTQALMQVKSSHKMRLIALTASAQGDVAQALGSAMGAFARTVRLEQPRLAYQALELPTPDWDLVVKEAANLQDAEVRYAGDVRYVKQIVEAEAPKRARTPLRRNGVYLLTGGFGGLGMIFAEYLAKQGQPTLVLTGRSALTADGEAKLERLKRQGANAMYLQADISKRTEVERLLADVRSRFGGLNGIVHSAGVVRDAFLLKKPLRDFRAVLAPKLYGTAHLEALTRADNLDFLILFSSMASMLGNVGQADYAYGNGFLDALAERRSGAGAKVVSINWPLWKDGGMHVDAETENFFKREYGFVALSVSAGLQAFDDALVLPNSQLLVLEGDAALIRAKFAEIAQPVRAAAIEAEVKQDLTTDQKQGLKANAESFLKEVLSQEMKLPPERIHSQEPLDKYGIDSVVIMNVTRELEEHFGTLSKTLFFEYQNVEDLAGYFMDRHAETIKKKIGYEEAAADAVRPATAPAKKAPRRESARSRFLDRGRAAQPDAQVAGLAVQEDEVAIIGLSGRYPQAKTLDQFWENLKQGTDAVIEIPADRWDYQNDFTSDKDAKGKSYSKWGGFLEDVDKFDPLFFSISPREVETIDPQERMFIETAWHAFEDAGYTRARLSQKVVGVYVGVMYGHYQMYGAQEAMKGNPLGLSSSFSAIANRVSYFLNLSGPSMAVDTMCSSSLTALHLACESLRRGETDMAIAGGVNVSIHPNKYILLSAGKFLATDGRCRAFGEGGDGYVPGEGTGAVLLKPLKKAIADGDPIYAVIKSTSLNHGGKTNGFSVPNPNAQGNLIAKALEKANIDARTISYVEAHGTGTALGDPIEITGLTKAFSHSTEEKQFCAIGSVKSNIGHLESAAGIAGLTKVLLQLKHRTLVPSLHADSLNPNIDFAQTPFVVQTTLTDWNRPKFTVNGTEQEFPRRSALSSFGAGGSNAHVIIEEYPVEFASPPAPDTPQLFVLSAKNAARLQDYAKSFLQFTQAQGESLDLAATAYTLQIGREAMEERLAFVVSTVGELGDKLHAFLNGNGSRASVAQGNIKGNAVTNDLLLRGEEGQVYLNSLIANGRLEMLAHLWVAGAEIDWTLLPDRTSTRILSLPVYPFARDRYWFQAATGNVEVATIQNLHPLVHRNVSTVREQKYVTDLRGDEAILTTLWGSTVLSAGMLLEMIRAAGTLADESEILRVCKFVSAEPLLVEAPREVRLSIQPLEDRLEIEVSGVDAAGEPVIYAQAQVLSERSQNGAALDLLAIRARAEATDFTARVQQQGWKTASGIQALYLNREEALVQTSSLEGALQAASLWLGQETQLLRTVEVAEWFAELPETAWVHITRADGEMLNLTITDALGAPVARLQNALFVPVAIREVGHQRLLVKSWRADESAVAVQKQPGRIVALVTDETLAIAESVQHLQPSVELTLINTKTLLIAEHGTNAAQSLLTQEGRISALLDLSDLSDLRNEPITVSEPPFGKIMFLQELLKELRKDDFYVLHVTRGLQNFQATDLTLAGAEMAGLVKLIGAEYRKLWAKTVDLDHRPEQAEEIAKLVWQELYGQDTVGEVIYRQGRRYLPELQDAGSASAPTPNLDPDQVYVITGGTRGIGAAMAKHLVERGAKRLVLMGMQSYPARGEWEAILQDPQAKPALLQRLQAILDLEGSGVHVETYAGALNERDALQAFFQGVREKLGPIGGVIHCAGLASDENPAFLQKTQSEMARVFQPKVQGVQVLHDLFAGDSLAFFVLISSISGTVATLAPGGIDYAMANSFLDTFANYQRAQGSQLLSIQWPNWKEIGMGEVTGKSYRELGLRTLPTAEGLALLDLAMQHLDKPCVMPLSVISADWTPDKMLCTKQAAPVVKKAEAILPAPTPVPTLDTDSSETKDRLKSLFSNELKIPLDQMDNETVFGDFGVDSVLLADLVKKIEGWIGKNLDPALLLEYSTFNLLSEHLDEVFNLRQPAQTAQLETITAPTKPVAAAVIASASVNTMTGSGRIAFLAPLAEPLVPLKRKHSAPARVSYAATSSAVKPGWSKIAVIGMACHFPGAPEIDTYWHNLINGISSIIEVPKSRFDIDKYYSQVAQPGKSISKWGGFIEGIEYFDPTYFQLSPEDAPHFDPLVRQFLEVSTQVFRHAGYEKSEVSGKKVGVFVGSRVATYGERVKTMAKNSVPGLGQNFIAAHISHFMNLKGPNLVVDTACSSSLVSLHLACQSLMSGESDMAIAGGVDILLDEKPFLGLSAGKALSPDGRCYTFDEKANGFVPGEGAGAVLLKPLEQAVADGDTIYAVIDSTAVNNDGHTMGITTPNPDMQSAVIREALQKGRLSASSVSFLETHGTGTMIGDPIELKALTRVFREFTDEKQFCSVGSVKTNFGHLLSAAGIASIIKVVLSIWHQQLPPTLNCDKPNPRFEFANSPFYPNTTLRDWVPREGVRRAGISSFGFGGTNAHVIIGEPDLSQFPIYQPKRSPLAPVQFNRSRFWLDAEETETVQSSSSIANSALLKIVRMS